MSVYELILLLGEKSNQKEKALGVISEVLKEGSGKVVSERSLGLRDLAYPIDKQVKGEYYLIEMEAQAQTIKPLNQKLRLSGSVLRYLIVKRGERES